MTPHQVPEEGIEVGDHVRLHPQPSNRWWTVQARDDRYIVATQQAPFQPAGVHQYTVLDLAGWQDKTRNGAGPGVVRSSLNTLGGGFDVGENGADSADVLLALRDGFELSHRRAVTVDRIETRTDAQAERWQRTHRCTTERKP